VQYLIQIFIRNGKIDYQASKGVDVREANLRLLTGPSAESIDSSRITRCESACRDSTTERPSLMLAPPSSMALRVLKNCTKHLPFFCTVCIATCLTFREMGTTVQNPAFAHQNLEARLPLLLPSETKVYSNRVPGQ